jgi:hypothetical protein
LCRLARCMSQNWCTYLYSLIVFQTLMLRNTSLNLL